AMWLMLQQDEPRDYVIATGQAHSVRELVVHALEAAGLEPDLDRYVRFDKALLRPAEVDYLVGDSSRARAELGWAPSVDFTGLVEMMVEHDLRVAAESR
ncbi:MAG: GDP-mannose 4,6-dehydratase, partial [Actinomycetota bacterium]